ncbi:MAG: PASTA domain-containing protein [Anaerolineales bacterium]|nr:PASTA domain-containing protein [Anaerolineales bacterium]MCB8952991.1 PASTA domain-containing protein [Ardenticatenales bacterium]
MSNEFTITALSNSVQLNAKREGSATYTAFNASGRPITGRAILETMPGGMPHAAWLKVAGESERAFAIGAAEQFTVHVNVPDTVTAGSYNFRLKMVDVTNTDEGVSEGPTVTVVVPEPVSGGAKFPIWIIPIIVGVLAVIALIVFLITRPKTATMPNVVGLVETDAEGTLVAEGLQIGRVRDEASDDVAAGLVARTEPEAGADVEKATRVALYLSTGPDVTMTPTPTNTPVFTPTPTPTKQPTHTPTPTIDPSLLAFYPLARNGREVTGRNDDLDLQAISFVDEAAYCNGQYDLNNASGCRIQTPQISGMNFNRFTIAVEFKADELANRPVFIGGRGYRWIGFVLKSDGGIRLKYNNSNYADCTVTYQAGRWYSARVIYNQGEARLYLNGVLGCTVSFTIDHGNNANVMVTDYSNATLFKGYIRNLQIYNAALVP